MKAFLLFTIVSLALMTIDCDQTGKPMGFSQACAAENDQKYVTVDGFLDDRGAVSCSDHYGIMSCSFEFSENLNDPKFMSAYVPIGTWANNVEKLQDKYKREDVKFHANDGKIVGLGQKLKITGKLRTTSDPNHCFMNVSKIEAQ